MKKEAWEKEWIGKTLTSVNVIKEDHYDRIIFTFEDNTEKYEMFHYQDCCEHVYIEDICGDLNNLVGSPLLMAEVVYKREEETEEADDYDHEPGETWTFYKFATIKGYVTIRWYGSSNGYYCEVATIEKMRDDED